MGGSAYQSSSSSYGGYDQQDLSGGLSVGGGGYNSGSYEQSSSSATRYATDAQGLFQDSNPQIIRRPALGGGQTYTQRVVVKFLQPPPLPPPGVRISNSLFYLMDRQNGFFFDHFSL